MCLFGNNNGIGGDSWIWILIIIVILCCCCDNGNNGNCNLGNLGNSNCCCD
ncbi:MAG: hypothetical protein UIM24_06085 [Clostridia bacterium]|nr:hypothetical protein [Clostridia bacterium]